MLSQRQEDVSDYHREFVVSNGKKGAINCGERQRLPFGLEVAHGGTVADKAAIGIS